MKPGNNYHGTLPALPTDFSFDLRIESVLGNDATEAREKDL